MRASFVCLLLLLCSSVALAHGGSYKPPPVAGGGPGGGVPPGTADPPTPPTRWESWWASNKHFYLRLGQRMRDVQDTGTATPSTGDAATTERSGVERRFVEDAKLRSDLVPLFIEALGDDNFEVRNSAAIALGKTGDERGAAPLRKAAVEDDHKTVREAALLALGLLGRDADVPFLSDQLDDVKADTRYRSFAAFSLGLMESEMGAIPLFRFADPKQGPKFVGGSNKERPLVASLMIALGLSGHPDAPAFLREQYASKQHDYGVKSFVLLSLGRLGDQQSVPLMLEAIRHKDSEIRRSAAIALGRLAESGDQSIYAALFRALERDSDPVTRQFAAISLGQSGDDGVKAELRKLFDDVRQIDQSFVALALALAHDQEAAPMLRKALAKAKAESDRGGYCIALALLGDTESAPLIRAQLEANGRVWLQGYAAIALGLLRHEESADDLHELLDDTNDPGLRVNLAVGLGLMADPRAKVYLLETLEGDGSMYERGSAAMSLAVLRINSAAPNLEAVYRDEKAPDLTRAFAVVALGILADPSPTPKLSRFSIDNNYSTTIDPLSEVLSIL